MTDAPPRCPIPALLGLAVLVGIIAGLSAWVFRLLIGLVHNIAFLGQFSFIYDANLHTAPPPFGAWVILAPVIGGVIVAWLVSSFAPEAKGHGVPEVMDAIHFREGRIRPQVALVKSLASAISIGSGAAVGREGPIVQIGAAFGSTLGQAVPMGASDRRILVAAGAGAGIAATFDTPLGGLAFAIELLLLAVSARSVLVVTVAVVVATRIGNALLGAGPAFVVPALEVAHEVLFAPGALLAFLALGALMGLLAAGFIRAIYGAEDLFDAIPGNYYTRHMLGMLCLGVILWLLLERAGHYYVQGVGYATIMDVLTGALGDPWFLLLLAALKLLATALSLGSGASGGVFSPALFLGATAGAAFGLLVERLVPGLGVGVPAFALAGMAGMVAGTTGAVLTAIIMITGMSGDTAIALPLLLAAAAAWWTRRAVMAESIYTMKLLARGHAVPEGLQAPVLPMRRVADAMTEPVGFELHASESSGIGAVRDNQGRLLRHVTARAEESLLAAATRMHDAGAEVILVLPDGATAPDAVIGVVTQRALVGQLKAELERQG
ncbi:MAG: chloride channel protein [Acetobacteraceae bacterium]|nr:chloride channel protein [Acetobacteraceae bacterium]